MKFWNTKKNPITMLVDLSPKENERLKKKHKNYYNKKKELITD